MRETKVYRFKSYYQWVGFLQASGAVLLGGCLIALESKNRLIWGGPFGSGLFGIALLFLAAYLVAQVMCSEVVLAPQTVSLRTVWGTRSLAKDEILGVKIVWQS